MDLRRRNSSLLVAGFGLVALGACVSDAASDGESTSADCGGASNPPRVDIGAAIRATHEYYSSLAAERWAEDAARAKQCADFLKRHTSWRELIQVVRAERRDHQEGRLNVTASVCFDPDVGPKGTLFGVPYLYFFPQGFPNGALRSDSDQWAIYAKVVDESPQPLRDIRAMPLSQSPLEDKQPLVAETFVSPERLFRLRMRWQLWEVLAADPDRYSADWPQPDETVRARGIARVELLTGWAWVPMTSNANGGPVAAGEPADVTLARPVIQP